MEGIKSYNEEEKKDNISEFKWLSRMSCYCEGTRYGFMKIRDIERKGECIIQLQGGFTEQVKMIHYNENKNVLFASSKDGQFKVWKMPHEWRAKSIDRKEMEAEYERRKSERLRKTGKSTGK